MKRAAIDTEQKKKTPGRFLYNTSLQCSTLFHVVVVVTKKRRGERPGCLYVYNFIFVHSLCVYSLLYSSESIKNRRKRRIDILLVFWKKKILLVGSESWRRLVPVYARVPCRAALCAVHQFQVLAFSHCCCSILLSYSTFELEKKKKMKINLNVYNTEVTNGPILFSFC